MDNDSGTKEYELFRSWGLYERVVQFNHMQHREITVAVRAAIAELPQPLRVLDLGCGAGELAWAVLGSVAVSEYVGIDLSADAVHQLTEKNPPGTVGPEVRVTGICGEMLEELSKLPPARFDLVMASYSIHHFPGPRKPSVLGEVARVLAPQGRFIWADLVCQDGESAADYLTRTCERIRREWNSLGPEEKETTCTHALNCDFPEQSAAMEQMAASTGLHQEKLLYRDSHYGCWVFRSINSRTLLSMLAVGVACLSVWLSLLSPGLLAAAPQTDPYSSLKPWSGGHVEHGDASTLKGKVICGYQGWYAAEGDGSNRGWVHYGGPDGVFAPGNCSIDLWPDVSELEADERYATDFRHVDGRRAFVFSPYEARTVTRHFKWMQEAGIDGAFLQRFGSDLRDPRALAHRNVVMRNVRQAANRNGRVWALMYDLSGLEAGEIEEVVIADWKRLVDRMRIRSDPAYLQHEGKPIVAVWGVGFSDGRKYSLDECERLVKFLKSDSKYGNNTVLLGVPTYWRALTRDAVQDARLHEVIQQADIVSPWTVGRYQTPAAAEQHAQELLQPDLNWAGEHKLDYLPVVFPGFSWQNLQRSRGNERPLNEIPRLGGQFLWTQAMADMKAGAEMIYVAMFDELDEGTAIFKCTNKPPVGVSEFLDLEGLPSDHYLWVTGLIGQVLRNELASTFDLPAGAAWDEAKSKLKQRQAPLRKSDE